MPAAHMQCRKLRAKTNQQLNERGEEWKMTLGFSSSILFGEIYSTVVPAAHMQCERLEDRDKTNATGKGRKDDDIWVSLFDSIWQE